MLKPLLRVSPQFSIKSALFFFFLALMMLFITPARSEASAQLAAKEQAYLDTKPYLSVLALDSFPPFSYSEDGVVKGYTADYMREMGRLLNKEVRFVSGVHWFEALRMLRAGELDIIPTIVETSERRAYIDFTSFKHIEYISAAVFHRDQAGVPLEKQIIAVAKNTFLHDHLQEHYPNIFLLVTASTDEAVLAVASGRADIAVSSYPSLDFYIQKHWLSNLMTGQVPGLELPGQTSLSMGVQKGNTLLNSILSKGEAAMPQSFVSGLKERWMSSRHRTDDAAGLTTEEVRFLRAHPDLKLCVDPDWMPLEGLEDGQHTGIASELMALVAEQLNTRFTPVESGSWSETLRQAQTGKCDIFPLIMKTPDRESFLSFTRPFVESPLVLVTGINEAYLPSLKELQNKRIGTVKGYAFNPMLSEQYPDLTFVEVDNIEQGLAKVRSGELFGYIDSLIASGYWVQKHYLGQLKVSSEIDRFWQLSMGVRNELQPLDSILNKVISQIPLSSRQEVINRWVSIRYAAQHDWLITLAGIFATVFILGGVIIWYVRLNLMLKKEVRLKEEAQEAALNLARTDQLTGLMNRHGSEPLIEQEMARCRRYKIPVCMMILDIDYFKRINDSLGHKVGDDVLCWFGAVMAGVTREADYLVRWGGEEFLVLLPDTELSAARELAERYRRQIEEGAAKAAVAFTVSIGVSQLDPEDSFSHWYQRTDLALYQAKNSGRNRVHVFDKNSERQVTE
ncbi:diguanylate cyclase [Oceanospirillum sp.]|uniref:transporter substrate-binding domain-containing diguanylate cyclase n=1 Tax=Oceanospirillum sp. TaxID=2021254 RepID=UPI003A8E55B6